MSDYKPFVGDEGTVIEIDMQEDLSSWSNLKYYVNKPKSGGGTEEKVVLAPKKGASGGAEQIMKYTIGSGSGDAVVNFDAPGMYYFQPYGEVSGWKGKGDTISFMVYSKYK